MRRARRTLAELLLADHPSPCERQQATADCELERLGAAYGVGTPRFAARTWPRGLDQSSLFISVDHTACILCDRCIRGCTEIKHNNVIGRTGKGYLAGISFDNDLPMATSSCVGCGECMVTCPTGALTNRKVLDVDLPHGDEMTSEELKALPIFERMSGTFLDLNRGAVVQRHLRAGEVICREGDFGSTAFYVLSGKVQVSIATPLGHSAARRGTRSGRKGFFRMLTELVKSPVARDRGPRDALHPHRRHRRPRPEQPGGPARARRPLRRDDVPELLPALGHRARDGRHRRPRDAAQRAADAPEGQGLQGRPGPPLPRARARHAPAHGAGTRRPQRRVRGAAARPGRASPLRAGPGHLQAGRGGRQLLLDPDRLREGDADVPGRRPRRALPRTDPTTSARSACSARACARPPAPRSTTSRSCASPPTTSAP